MTDNHSTSLPDKPRRKRGCRYIRNLAVAAVIFFFLLTYTVGWITTSAEWAYPRREPLNGVTPRDTGITTYENVSITTVDGLTLHGWYLPSQNRAAVVLAHGLGQNRNYMLPYAFHLVNAGYGVLLFDLRAHGESEGALLTMHGDDVLAAVAFLQSRPEIDLARIGVLGFSMGGIVIIEAAAHSSAIRAVLVDGPGPTAFSDMPPAQTVSEWLYVPFDLLFFPVLSLRTGQPNPPPIIEAIAAIAPRPVMLVSAGGAES